MPDKQKWLQANRERWDELVAIHSRSDFYDLDSFRAGRLSLTPLEREELGDVTGKSLLHLQCHFGLDTLSWARLGAQVTGADFSPAAIELARSLSRELGIDARFVCSDVDSLPEALDGPFDVVFTSYGVLCWLPDLRRWGEVIAHFLRPGGTFYIAEIHPFAMLFDDENAEGLQPRYTYFQGPEPMHFENVWTYTDSERPVDHTTTYEWNHTMGEIVNALLDAGLRLVFLHEFPFACFRMFPFLEQGEDGWWRLREQDVPIPMTFSIKAVKA
jgi:SAM-dependent methyltransferase